MDDAGRDAGQRADPGDRGVGKAVLVDGGDRRSNQLPAPDRIVAFQWPASVRVLVSSGVWDAIQQRVCSLGGAETTCLAVLSDLQTEERQELIKAVKGEEPYRTLRGINN